MKYISIIILILFVHKIISQDVSDKNSEKKISESVTEFTKALYTVLAKKDASENIIFSPFSIHVILSLTSMGAGGGTAQELAAGLYLPSDPALVKKGFQQLLQSIQGNTNATLEIANTIYISRAICVKKDFVKTAKQYFQSDVRNVDFHLPNSNRIINKWVEEKTHKKITNLIADGTLSKATKVVLINAVYFKGVWSQTFPEDNTKSLPFFVTQEDTKDVQMMNVEGNFKVKQFYEIAADVLVLPYEGGNQGLIVILPMKVDGLSQVEDKLRSVNLNQIIEGLQESEVSVFFPKLKLELTTQLVDVLQKLGIKEIFEDVADFSQMSRVPLKVTEVFQKAFIEVNEKGTEAAAATVVGMAYESDFGNEIVFKADHPFIFLLYCFKSETILFMGRYSKP